MPQITSQGFLTRNIIEYLTDSRRVKQYRCNTLQNPLAYKKGNQLLPVDVANVADSFTAQAGSIWLRDRNIVSVGIKKGDDAYKCFGLRPDEDQSGNEQLEWSIEAIEKNGKAQSIDLSEKQIISPVAQNLGPLVVQSTRQRTRIMLPMTGADEGFRIALRLHLKGLTVQYRADLDEYWIYNAKGQFRFRLGKPYLVGLNTEGFHDPLDFSDLEAQPVLVQHKLIDNGDGTYTYIKEPGPDFGRVKLPSTFWVDADTVYSSTADGGILGDSDLSWSVARTNTGTDLYDTGMIWNYAASALLQRSNYTFGRSFFYFDVSALSGSVAGCNQFAHSYATWDTDFSAQKGTQASPLATSDMCAFSGDSYGYVAAASSGYNEIAFNATGRADVQGAFGGTAKTCLREKSHDYDDVPITEPVANGLYYAETAGTSSDPYLYITIATGWTGKIWGVTNPAKIWGIPVANIAKVGGI